MLFIFSKLVTKVPPQAVLPDFLSIFPENIRNPELFCIQGLQKRNNSLKRINCKNRNNNPANIYLFQVNNRNTRERSKMCSELTTKTPERLQ